MHHLPDLLRRPGAEPHPDAAARAGRHRWIVRSAERSRRRGAARWPR